VFLPVLHSIFQDVADSARAAACRSNLNSLAHCRIFMPVITMDILLWWSRPTGGGFLFSKDIFTEQMVTPARLPAVQITGTDFTETMILLQ